MNSIKLKRHSVQIYEGLEITTEILQEEKQATLRGFIKGVRMVEIITPEKIIVSTPLDRLRISPGDWILKFIPEDQGISLNSPKVRYLVVSPEEIKKYEQIKNQS